MKKALLILIVASMLFLSIGGCTSFAPKDRQLIKSYCDVSDITLEKIEADATTPAWVKESAKADNRAFHAILRMGVWKSLWSKGSED